MTEDAQSTSLDVGDRLPIGSVITADGATVQLRPSARRATILVVAHGRDCEDCQAYLAALDDGVATLDRWAARPLAVLPDADVADARSVPAVVDEDGRIRRQLAVPEEDVAVVVADRHGEIWAVTRQRDHHDLPDVDDLEQEVRFIAIQCPECEVPDTAALGEWAAAGT